MDGPFGDALQAAMGSLCVIVGPVLAVHRCSVVDIPHSRWKDRVSSRAVSMQSPDVVVLQPVQHWLECWIEARLCVCDVLNGRGSRTVAHWETQLALFEMRRF